MGIGESQADILAFFTTAAFARAVTWSVTTIVNSATVVTSSTVLGIFDEGDQAHDYNGQRVEQMVSQPMLRCPYFQIKSAKRGDGIAFTDPSGTARTFTMSRNPEREADGLTAILFLRET